MLAIACPGQGAQKQGFLAPWLERSGFAHTLDGLAEAGQIDLRKHGTVSDDETIKDTAIAQPLLVAAAIACYREISRDLPAPQFLAGHSVGEIGAAAIAGILSDADAMRFVHVRASGMAAASAAVPTGMAAVVGGVAEDVIAAIEAANLTPANVNGGGQIVAAGSQQALAAFADNPPERARVLPLKVAGAFHTHYMAQAQPALQDLADQLAPGDPQIAILSNADGAQVADGRAYLNALVSQVTHPVRWDLCQQTLAGAGVTGLLELVPGGTLTGIARRALKGVETFAVKSADDVDAARDFIAEHAAH